MPQNTIQVKICSPNELRQGSPVSVGRDLAAISPPKIVGKKASQDASISNIDLWSQIDYIEYDSGVSLFPGNSNYTVIMPRSSLSKYNLLLANSVGLIDPDYRGNLILRFKYIIQPEDLVISGENTWKLLTKVNLSKIYSQGDYIGQIVFHNTLTPTFQSVASLDETERGAGGFGHSDSKK